MEIKIKNKIKVGDQTEIIEEIHTCEVMEKGDFTYLVHHNSEKEKVVIKLNQDELVMTRFSNPKSIMLGTKWCRYVDQGRDLSRKTHNGFRIRKVCHH